jgi:transposase-like protein
VIKFGPLIAANLRRRRGPPSPRWHLDEMVVKINGRRMWLWGAVDDNGEVQDMLVQKRRNAHAAIKLLRKLLRRQGVHPETIATDKTVVVPFRDEKAEHDGPSGLKTRRPKASKPWVSVVFR